MSYGQFPITWRGNAATTIGGGFVAIDVVVDNVRMFGAGL